jgi:acylphosphatase
MKATHILVAGFVQGVGYRKFVRDVARKMELVGFVRNMPDNSVEVIVAGPAEKIKQLIELCKKGPFLSEVKEVRANEIETQEEFTEFLVRHDF